MNIHPDFEELLELLEEHKVECMIVGGFAVAFHGHPRFTKDIDIFFRISSENIQRLRGALQQFGFISDEIPASAFVEAENVLTLGAPPSRVDLLGKIDGVEFSEAFSNLVRGSYSGV